VGISRFIYVWRLLELVWARAKKADQDDFLRLPVFCPRREKGRVPNWPWAEEDGPERSIHVYVYKHDSNKCVCMF